MISEKMQKALNDQINAEMFSSYLYLSMAAYLESQNWNGMSAWMKAQSVEEYQHAMKFYGFINEVGGTVVLEAIEKPKSTWNKPQEIFAEAYKHEQYVTKRIHDLVALAIEEKDYATNLFLNWFVTEQVEEEATVVLINHKFNLIGDNNTSLFLLDRELGMRAEK
ncbi:MAG: Ferritin-like protein [Ignavibacteria bacterium]|nr:MAG: Ferritin-like protein [Ignavibacteria bacterium]KAF0158309.1 MAG: Ferritin-like protein [Ignavibacteria bacterium]